MEEIFNKMLDEMAKVIEPYKDDMLKSKFDCVILDCSPTIGLPDALLRSRSSDKVLSVSAIDYTPTDMLINTQKSLENVNAKIAGVVVNKVKGSSSSYYSKYYE